MAARIKFESNNPRGVRASHAADVHAPRHCACVAQWRRACRQPRGELSAQCGGGRRVRWIVALHSPFVRPRSLSVDRSGTYIFTFYRSAGIVTQTNTPPSADQVICRRVESSIANTEKDATCARCARDQSVTNEQSLDTGKMSAMKTSGTPGTARVLPALRHLKYEHFVAGISGGVVSTLMLHPLDLIKTRFAVNDGHSRVGPQYKSLKSAIMQIVKTEGVPGLYRGVTPNVLGSGGAWGCYFFFYNTIKTWIQGGNSRKPLGPSMHMFAAADAGILTLLMTNPLWVVKTRLCLQYMDDKHLPETQRYTGMVDAIKKIYRTEGVRGLYRGFVPGMFGVSHGAIQFMVYEELKNYYNNYQHVPIDTKLNTWEYIFFAAISKLIAAASTYPYQVVRARLQDHHHHYDGSVHCVQTIWRHEGWRGFYKGLSANITRVTPATVITFVVYENVSHYLQNRSRIEEEHAALPILVKNVEELK